MVDFRDERGYKKLRVTSCTTIMAQENRREQRAKDAKLRREERARERYKKKHEGMNSLF